MAERCAPIAAMFIAAVCTKKDALPCSRHQQDLLPVYKYTQRNPRAERPNSSADPALYQALLSYIYTHVRSR